MTKIDWLRMTDKGEGIADTYSAMLQYHLGQGSERKPFFGYSKSLRFDCGATMHWNDIRPDMGRMWDFNAEAIDSVGQEAAHVILSWTRDYPVNLRRIDIAHDILNQETSIDLIHNQVTRGMENGECRKRLYNPMLGDSKRILEIGARTSNLYTRAYDKGLELNLAEYKKDNWVRIEFEIKDDLAIGLQKAIHENSEMSYSEWIPAVWLGLFRNVFPQTPAMCGDWFSWGIQPIWGALPRKETDTRYWLETQVRSGILNYVANHNDGEQWFYDYCRGLIDDIEKRRNNKR